MVVKLLLHRGCNTAIETDSGRTGLDVAIARFHDHVVRILENHHAPRGTERTQTPPKREKQVLGRVAERQRWTQFLLRRHVAEADNPCTNLQIVEEVLRAQRRMIRHGDIVDENENRSAQASQFDVSAAARALKAATARPALALPELLPSVILWRALMHTVTSDPGGADAAGAHAAKRV